MCVSVKLSRICCRRVTTFFFLLPFTKRGRIDKLEKRILCSTFVFFSFFFFVLS